MNDMGESPVKDKISFIRKAIFTAAENCGRDPASVHLVAVSKKMAVEKIRSAISAGAQILGENYIQEATCKIDALSAFPVSWHFIGHLQTNKAKLAVGLFDLIHTVDSLKIAKELNKHAKNRYKCQKILVQVNISKEINKSGIGSDEAANLVRDISMLDHLSVRGLMTMPPYSHDPEHARPYFKALYQLSKTIKQMAIPGVLMTQLSMGMTRDFTVAIEEGATLVRIGTAIFGKRQ